MAWAKDANLGTATGSGASLALTTSAPAAAGAWIFLGAGNFGGQTLVSVAGGGLSWQVLGARANGSVQSAIAAAYAPSGLPSSTALTATFTASTGEIKLGAVSYVGGVAASGLDGAAATNVGSTAAWSISPSLGLSDSLVVGFAALNTNSSSTPDGVTTENLDFQFSGSSTAVLCDRVASASGSNPVGGTWGATSTWAGVAVGFTLAAAPIPPITTLGLTGFEHGFIAAAASAGGGLFDAAPSAGCSASTSSPRNGSYCAHLVAPAATATRLVNNITGSPTKILMRFGIKVTARPSSGAAIVANLPGASAAAVTLQITSAGVLQAQAGAGTAQNGPTIDTTNWHLIEFQYDSTAKTLDWKVDGVAQTRATHTGTAVPAVAVVLGTPAVATGLPAFTADYDDVIAGTWADAATHWYGDGKVIAQLPGSDVAAHTSVTSFSFGDAGTALSGTVTTAYTMVDDPPGTGGWTATRSTTDNLALRVASPGTADLEMRPVPTAETGVANAVKAIISYSSPSATANLASCVAFTPPATLTPIWGSKPGSGAGADYSETTNQFKSLILPAPAEGWIPSRVNNAEVIFGSCTSADISPVPTLQAWMLEVDWPVVSGPTTHFGVVARASTFGAVTQARRSTFAQVARPVTFGAVTAGVTSAGPTTHFGVVARATVFGATTAGVKLGGPFAPSDLPGLGVWLDASTLGLANGAAVTTWPDASGGAHNAAAIDTAPVYRATGFNGRPTVEFSGTSGTATRLRVSGWGTLLSGKTNYTLFYVLQPKSGFPAYSPVLLTAPTDAAFRYLHEFAPGGDFYVAHVNGGYRAYHPAFGDTEKLLLSLHHTLGGTRLYKFGVEMASYNDNGAGLPQTVDSGLGADALLGGYIDASKIGSDVYVCEVLWYDHALTDVERQQVESYLNAKWLATGPTTHYGSTSMAVTLGAATQGQRKAFGQVARASMFAAVTAGQRKAFGQVARSSVFAATTVGQRKTFAQVAWPSAFGAATAGRRQALGQVARASTFAAVTSAQRRTFGQVARPATFAAVTQAQRRTFGSIACPSSFAAVVQARRTTFSGTVAPLLFTAATAGQRVAAGLYGAVSLPVSFGAATAARRQTFGLVALPASLGAVTAARRRTTSAVAMQVALGAVVAGRRRTFAVVARPATFGAVVQGRRRTHSATVSPLAFGAATAGQRVPFQRFGAVTAVYTLGAVTVARRKTFGVVALPVTVSRATAAWRKALGVVALPVDVLIDTHGIGEIPANTHLGRFDLTVDLALATNGRRRTFAQVARPLTFGEVTAGRRRAFGAVARPITLLVDARGATTRFGAVALPLTLTRAVAGQREALGQVALALVVGEVTAGRRLALGQVALALTLDEATAASRETFGVLSQSLTLKMFTIVGYPFTVLNFADAIIIGGRAVDEVAVGDEQVWPVS